MYVTRNMIEVSWYQGINIAKDETADPMNQIALKGAEKLLKILKFVKSCYTHVKIDKNLTT